MTNTHKTTVSMTVAGIEGCDVPILVDYIVCKGFPRTQEDPGEPAHIEIEEVRIAPEACIDDPPGVDRRIELSEDQEERITREIEEDLDAMADHNPHDDYDD